MLLRGSLSEWTTVIQSSSVSFGLSKWPFQFSRSWVSEMLSGALPSSLLTGWQLNFGIQLTFTIWVRPVGMSFVEKVGGKGDLSDNVNAAARSWWKSDEYDFTISSVSEIYPTVGICLFWGRDLFLVSDRFWLHCHISIKLWTLAILCNVHSAASFIICKSFPVVLVSILGKHLPKSRYCLKQSTLQRLFHQGSCLLFLTASSPYHLGQGKYWSGLWHCVVLLTICPTPNWRDQPTLSGFPPVTTTSQ